MNARIYKGWKQQDVVDMLKDAGVKKISQPTYSAYELGTRKYPEQTARILSEIFDIPYEKFIEDGE